MTGQHLHEVAITAIISKDGKYLITRRAATKKRFPGKWTVPGGKLETDDYLALPRDTAEYWYNVLERTLKREVKEEVGLEIDHVEYLTSLATIHAGGSPSLVISCTADWQSGETVLQKEELDSAAWVSVAQAREYDLIDGIFDELLLADRKRSGNREEWHRA